MRKWNFLVIVAILVIGTSCKKNEIERLESQVNAKDRQLREQEAELAFIEAMGAARKYDPSLTFEKTGGVVTAVLDEYGDVLFEVTWNNGQTKVLTIAGSEELHSFNAVSGLLEKSDYQDNGIRDLEEKYTYADDGTLISKEIKMFDSQGHITNVSVYTYDDKGNTTNEVDFNAKTDYTYLR